MSPINIKLFRLIRIYASRQMTKRKQENLKWEGVIRSPSLDYITSINTCIAAQLQLFGFHNHFIVADSRWAKVVRYNSRWAKVVRYNSRWARVVTSTADGPRLSATTADGPGLSLQQPMGQGCPLQQPMGQGCPLQRPMDQGCPLQQPMGRGCPLQQNYCGNQVTAGEPQYMWIY